MKSQKQQILEILSDYQAHRSDEFQERMFGSTKVGLFRLGARIWELRQEGHSIRGRKDANNPALYWYQLIIPAPPEPIKEQAQLLTLNCVYE